MNATEVEQRLTAIFSTILGLPADAVLPQLSPETCPKWDSLNQIHLINSIEEEFGIQLEFEDQMRMLSFGVALEIVSASLAAA
jgi:acyl carrier protein